MIVAALELEAAAAKEHLRDVAEEVHPSGTVYFVGRFGDGPDAWRVAIVIAGAGNPTAAFELERAAQWFSPRIVLLVGVAGGLKDVALGDVVAADKLYLYERGKAQTQFLSRPEVWRSTYAAVQRAKIEVTKRDWQKRILGPEPTTTPTAFVGPIAAGEKVVSAHDSPVFALLRTSFSDALAVEMEGAGFLAAAHANAGVEALVVRGISDLVEGKAVADADGGQPRAARHAAAFAFQVLSTVQGTESVRGRGSLVNSDVLDVVVDGTTANTAALERIENALSVTAATLNAASPLPHELVDAEVERRLTRLRKSRFLMGSVPGQQASRLAQELISGDVQLASAGRKARALSWCARILLDSADRSLGKELIRAAAVLATMDEVSIAKAFDLFYEGDLAGALGTLSRLDSPMARAAAFIIVRKAKGPEEALVWLHQTGLSLTSLDSDGKFFVIAAQLEARQVDGSRISASALGHDDFEQTPALLFVAANAHLASVVPTELVPSVLSEPAASLVSLPLADGNTALEWRRAARRLYSRASQAANDIGCSVAASEASDRAMLLAISDPQSRLDARTELQESMRSSHQSVRRLPLALAAGLKVDLAVAEQEIDRQTTLSGGGTEHTALARLAIAREKPVSECAAYLRTHRDELTRHINPVYLAGIEIAALVHSGQLPVAEERLQEALQKGVLPKERDQLERLIANARESDPSASHERRFLDTDDLGDLLLLVRTLENGRDWARLAKYGAILFARVHDLTSCTAYVHSLFRLGEFRQLVEFLRTNDDLLAESASLRALLAWSLFNLGDLNASRTVLSELSASRDASEDRDLTVNLGITSGDWNSLASFVEQEWERRDARTAQETLRAGSIAHHIDSGRARALIAEAAKKAPDDPHVLIGCYSAAMGAGWEDETTFKWLEHAAALSPPDGPVQRVSLKELADRNPGWQKRQAQAWEQLNSGQIPLAGFGKVLNRSLVELVLLTALENVDTVDPRRRTLIYSYSGARRSSSGLPNSVAIDPIALLNLAFLGGLDGVLSSVGKIVIPHRTMAWLFEETQRVRVSQPSRVEDAHAIKRLLASKVLQQLDATAPIDEDLAREVGHDLASLFAEAEADWGADQRARYVVRSGPIHRLGSLMEEEATLGHHANHLRGGLDVVDALAKQGRLTQAEERRARAFLKLHEAQSADVPAIASGAVLYLDGVSLAHLQHLRLLPQFESTGFTIFISAEEVAEADRRIMYQDLVGRATALLQRLRESLRDGIANEKVIVAPAVHNLDGGDEGVQHPALDIVRIAPLAEVVVIDDRYLNQHAMVTHESGAVPIRTTFDLLNALQLPRHDHAERVARMRRGGLSFVPMTTYEVTELLEQAAVTNGRLGETAELKLLRENLQMCRMSVALQLPNEAVWFDGVVRTLLEGIRAQWKDGADIVAARARSDWLLQQLDLRGWSHRYANEKNRGISQLLFRRQLKALLISNAATSAGIRKAYWQWLEEVLVGAIKEEQGDLYDAVVDDLTMLIASVVDRQQAAGDAGVN